MTLKTMPAIAAGIESKIWTVVDIIEMADWQESGSYKDAYSRVLVYRELYTFDSIGRGARFEFTTRAKAVSDI